MSQKSRDKLLNWAELRFSIIGQLLACGPDERGTLSKEFQKLARNRYRHPTTETEVGFCASTIERWYYKALKAEDPIQALGRKRRKDHGETRVVTVILLVALGQQYQSYQHWSYQLHLDNLKALAAERPELGEIPSYTTIRLLMKKKGWTKKPKPGKRTQGQERAADRLEQREVRSYEASHIHALWHLDFHQGSLRVVDARGDWHTPMALCILDDCCRVCCHIQWYLNETSECLIHGLSQAFCKYGLPRSLMTDNGAAMVAEETTNGLLALGVHHEKTLPYSPYQNGKQESFWGQLEGRFLAMLTRVESLTLDVLNQATQAWVHQEYNRGEHASLGTAPLNRLLQETDVSRPCPDSGELRFGFTRKAKRRQRLGDGTLTLEGVRFEVPSRFKNMTRLHLRHTSWDLTSAYLTDPETQQNLGVIYPLDKQKNANGQRRLLQADSTSSEVPADPDPQPLPPLVRKYMADYAAYGSPSFIPDQQEVPHEEH